MGQATTARISGEQSTNDDRDAAADSCPSGARGGSIGPESALLWLDLEDAKGTGGGMFHGLDFRISTSKAPADQQIVILQGHISRSAAPADSATPGKVQGKAPFHLGFGQCSHVRARYLFQARATTHGHKALAN